MVGEGAKKLKFHQMVTKCLFVCNASKGYERPDDEDGVEDVILEGEQRQAHVGEDEVLGQEVKDLKELHGKYITPDHFSSEKYAETIPVKRIRKRSISMQRFSVVMMHTFP